MYHVPFSHPQSKISPGPDTPPEGQTDGVAERFGGELSAFRRVKWPLARRVKNIVFFPKTNRVCEYPF